MSYDNVIGVIANWAAILTAILAAYAYGKFRYDRWVKRRKLEEHLRTERLMGIDSGMRTVIHLMANLAMTEAEIFAAAFESRKVRPGVSLDSRGRAESLLFEYEGDDIPLPKKF